jgi:hypothetical protein
LGVDRRRADFELHSAVLSQHLPNQFEMFDFSRQLFACPKVFAPGESYTFFGRFRFDDTKLLLLS